MSKKPASKKRPSKKSSGYVDSKIYNRKSIDAADKRIIGIEFGDLRLKTISKLVQSDDVIKSHHKDVGYLLRELGKTIRHQLGTDLCPQQVPEPVFSPKSVRIEFLISKSEIDNANKAIHHILKNEFKLNVAVIE